MTFKQQLVTDMLNVFLNSNEFAESITYTPNGGTGKTIKAAIERSRLSPSGEMNNNALGEEATIHIANDATYGVLSVAKGFDIVSFPVQVGGTAVSWTVIEILDHDDGSWSLLVRK